MKKIAFVLGFVFVASIGMSAVATTVNTDNGVKVTIVDNDKKPCPAGCTCTDCKAKTADGKAACDPAKKADCKAKSTDCTKKCDGKSADAKASSPTKASDTKAAAPKAEPAKK